MCGIFGVVAGENASLKPAVVKNAVDDLFRLSESRGKEASGLAVEKSSRIYIYKEPVSASSLIKSWNYKRIFSEMIGGGPHNQFAIFGHSRLATDGSAGLNQNNQPVIKDGIIGVHNGIIVNADELWSSFPVLKREYDVDTEVFLGLMKKFHTDGISLPKATKNAFEQISGATSVAVMFDDMNNLLLATNNGSLYTTTNTGKELLVFASEKSILQDLVHESKLGSYLNEGIMHVNPNNAVLVDLTTSKANSFGFEEAGDISWSDAVLSKPRDILTVPSAYHPLDLDDEAHYEIEPVVKQMMTEDWERIYSGRVSLRRCTKCVLPETMPFIEFDDEGVCNYCRGYKRMEVRGKEALKKRLEEYRGSDGEPDCLVAISGGRDSCYGLHYVKKVLGMNPLAFTYDWGMVTDLARRNISRVCGKLGVEHILVSADIKGKRENIRSNVHAWLKKPDLGMVPLLMAGDKQFYYYAHKLRERIGVKLFIFCAGNRFEDTLFKYGFCGINQHFGKTPLTDINAKKKFNLVKYYAKQYLANPSYINRSIFDTFSAYYSSYILPDDYLYLFHYLRWNENEIMTTLINEYDWETAKDTKATWRIGDGTAPFYNYIYMTVAGFTEFDTFASNQIREGDISREEALETIKESNKPRFEAIKWYAKKVGFDPNRAIKRINSIPRLYSHTS